MSSIALPIPDHGRGEFSGDAAAPVLFLDIDGVINAPEYNHRPAEAAVAALNLVLAWPDVQVVISSAWRVTDTILEIATQLEAWGVRALLGRIVGTTGYGLYRGGEVPRLVVVAERCVQRVRCDRDDAHERQPHRAGE